MIRLLIDKRDRIGWIVLVAGAVVAWVVECVR